MICWPACGVAFGPFLKDCWVMVNAMMGNMVSRMHVLDKQCNKQATHPIIIGIACAYVRHYMRQVRRVQTGGPSP